MSSTTFTITGHNQYGEVVTETFSSDVFDDPIVRELGYITKEKYASIGIDLEAELQKMTTKKKWWRWQSGRRGKSTNL